MDEQQQPLCEVDEADTRSASARALVTFENWYARVVLVAAIVIALAYWLGAS